MDTLIQNITLIDGTGRAPVEGAVLAIREGKIVYAGAASGWSDAAEEVMRLDLRGQFVLPGLIDALEKFETVHAKFYTTDLVENSKRFEKKTIHE